MSPGARSNGRSAREPSSTIARLSASSQRQPSRTERVPAMSVPTLGQGAGDRFETAIWIGSDTPTRIDRRRFAVDEPQALLEARERGRLGEKGLEALSGAKDRQSILLEERPAGVHAGQPAVQIAQPEVGSAVIERSAGAAQECMLVGRLSQADEIARRDADEEQPEGGDRTGARPTSRPAARCWIGSATRSARRGR